MAPTLSKVLKLVRWARRFMTSEDIKHKILSPPRPLSPSDSVVAGRQLVRAAVYASDSGRAYTVSWLV